MWNSKSVQADEEVRLRELSCPRPVFGKNGLSVCWCVKGTKCLEVGMSYESVQSPTSPQAPAPHMQIACSAANVNCRIWLAPG
jgi:hypothetical protein